MPVDINSSIKQASQWAFGSSFLNSVLSNSFFVAVLIALIMVILIMFMYPAKSGTSMLVLVKLFVYMLLGTVLVVFLHDSVIKYTIEEEEVRRSRQELFSGVTPDGRIANPVSRDQLVPAIDVNKTASVLGGVQQVPIQVPVPIQPPEVTPDVLGGRVVRAMRPPPYKPNPYGGVH